MNKTKLLNFINKSEDYIFNEWLMKDDIKFFKYNLESISKLEEHINRFHPLELEEVKSKERGSDVNPASICYGILLGQTFCKNIAGAKWVCKSENFLESEIIFQNKNREHIRIHPIIYMHKYFKDRTESLVKWYTMGEKMSKLTSKEISKQFESHILPTIH
jgi:hypothetical protein